MTGERIGLISDCEGNVGALGAALRSIKQHAPDLVVVAGDILASPFSPDPPSETIALLRSESSLGMLAKVDATLVLCGHIPSPREYRDQLPDGRELHVVRAGPRDAESVDYALLTRTAGAWQVHCRTTPTRIVRNICAERTNRSSVCWHAAVLGGARTSTASVST